MGWKLLLFTAGVGSGGRTRCLDLLLLNGWLDRLGLDRLSRPGRFLLGSLAKYKSIPNTIRYHRLAGRRSYLFLLPLLLSLLLQLLFLGLGQDATRPVMVVITTSCGGGSSGTLGGSLPALALLVR